MEREERIKMAKALLTDREVLANAGLHIETKDREFIIRPAFIRDNGEIEITDTFYTVEVIRIAEIADMLDLSALIKSDDESVYIRIF